jgi:glycosyltransferase involved in cell wall biosynthesis
MSIVFHTNIVSPHQLPWCIEFSELHSGGFTYLAEEGMHAERRAMGWGAGEGYDFVSIADDASRRELKSCDVLISTFRELDVFKSRARSGLRSFYMFERWFKPPLGRLRLFHPGYWLMCRRFAQLCKVGGIELLPIGIHAAEDIQHVVGDTVMMLPWGYFVKPSTETEPSQMESGRVKLLWCGRMLDWKRVDTLVKATVRLLETGVNLELKLIGHGPEERYLRQLASGWDEQIIFGDNLPIGEIRREMRETGIYVLSSDGGEGWGAVVNEAMCEGCLVVGTHEAGSSATMIRDGVNGLLYHAGDVDGLTRVLGKAVELVQDESGMAMRQAAMATMTGEWSPRQAAIRLLEFIRTSKQGAGS